MSNPRKEEIRSLPKRAGRVEPLAYKNEAFLDSDDGRAVRILAEYEEPLASFDAKGSVTLL